MPHSNPTDFKPASPAVLEQLLHLRAFTVQREFE